MKRLLSNTVKEVFGIDRQVSTFEVILFYLLVVITSLLAYYFI